MDKIIELICEEARRRPGKDFAFNIYSVKLEIDLKVGEIMETVREADRIENAGIPLEWLTENDT